MRKPNLTFMDFTRDDYMGREATPTNQIKLIARRIATNISGDYSDDHANFTLRISAFGVRKSTVPRVNQYTNFQDKLWRVESVSEPKSGINNLLSLVCREATNSGS